METRVMAKSWILSEKMILEEFWRPSSSSTSLTEDEFDLIAAESMFGQHLELQHLSEGDKRRW